MGQILNRVINFAKYRRVSQNSADIFFEIEDEELGKIIDELNAHNSWKNSSEKKDEYSIKNITIDKASSILKVDRNANQEQIKMVYLDRIKECHPDRLENYGSDLKALSKIRTQEINHAYSFITNLNK